MIVHFDDLISHVQNLLKHKIPILIAIDGRGGSGKSTLAKKIISHFDNSTIIEADDFYIPTHNQTEATRRNDLNFEWKRMKKQVLAPLHSAKFARYQRYDWPTDSLAEWQTLNPKELVLVEGCFTLRKELDIYFDFKIWKEESREICLERGLKREAGFRSAKEMKKVKKRWVDEFQPIEDYYILNHKPQKNADLIVGSTF